MLKCILPGVQPQQQAALAQLTQRYMEQVAARQQAQAASQAQGYQQAHAQAAQHQGQPHPGGQFHPGFAHAGAHVVRAHCACLRTRMQSCHVEKQCRGDHVKCLLCFLSNSHAFVGGLQTRCCF